MAFTLDVIMTRSSDEPPYVAIIATTNRYYVSFVGVRRIYTLYCIVGAIATVCVVAMYAFSLLSTGLMRSFFSVLVIVELILFVALIMTLAFSATIIHKFTKRPKLNHHERQWQHELQTKDPDDT